MRPTVTDEVAWSVGRSVRVVRYDREPCKNGWIDRHAVSAMDSGGP